MTLLAEYGLIPDVFDTACYTHADLCDVHLQNLKEVLLAEGLVRNFRDGEWLRGFGDGSRPWHKRGQELLKKLATQNRLRLSAARLSSVPAGDIDWCNEAIASHGALLLHGIVATDSTCAHFSTQPLVAPITKLSGAAWWQARSPSIRLNRTLADYQRHLGLVLACANSVMFIDPHLDPARPQYREFINLLQGAARRSPAPRFEVHRVCYFDSQDRRDQHDDAGWRNRFSSWINPLRTAQLSSEIFIWDDFHDRYVISDLIGIGLQNGFDTTTAPNAITTWSRLGRKDRDDIQREFDPASKRHSVRHRFTLP